MMRSFLFNVFLSRILLSFVVAFSLLSNFPILLQFHSSTRFCLISTVLFLFSLLSLLMDAHSIFLSRCFSFPHNFLLVSPATTSIWHSRSHPKKKYESKSLGQYFSVPFKLCGRNAEVSSIYTTIMMSIFVLGDVPLSIHVTPFP
jgi:hypothetical protein